MPGAWVFPMAPATTIGHDETGNRMARTDDELLEQARAGANEALAELLERHGPAVRGGLRGMIPARWQSLLSEDDVMQQTYADAAMGLASFESRGDGALRGWLAALARHNLLDAIKWLEAEKRGGRARRRLETPDDQSYVALWEHLAATSATPSRHAARGEARGVLATALENLPPLYRRVIELYDLRGSPAAEVAAELSRSTGAVFMLRSRAHERLAGLLGPSSAFFTHGTVSRPRNCR